MSRDRQPVAVSEECVPNIGERGRSRRRRNGLIALGLAATLAVWARSRGTVDWWVWLLLAALYAYAMLGVFQAHEKT